ncbi:MAG: insulinase family protein [Oscillospiraceae bacterium]|nr:insulinase family protein [Oscillospiraceae bacterium]
MLKIEKFDVSPRLRLTCARTDKFKTGCLSVNLITELTRENAAKNALLPRVLRRGTAVHPDMESLAVITDELYGARIEPTVRKKGELQCVGFFADFIDDDYLPNGESILERVTALVGEMLLTPKTHGGQLTSEYVDSERRNLIDEIRAGINEKRSYALDALLRNMCSEEAFGVNKLGGEREAKAITAHALTVHYKKLLDTARVEVFYCGNAEPGRVKSAVADALAGLPRTAAPETAGTQILLAPPAPETRKFTEKLDVTQGKLAIGLRLGKTMLAPNYAALAVFNAAFGGSVTSKLFLNVREKLSLCYYASSMIEKHKGVLIVSSGVEFANFDRAYNEILAQLDAIKSGDVSDWEFLSAKRAVMTERLAALDRPGGLEEACFDQMIAGITYTPEEFASLAEAVTREEIIAVANSAVLDSAYFMEGKTNEE